jgi:hypothetical protein
VSGRVEHKVIRVCQVWTVLTVPLVLLAIRGRWEHRVKQGREDRLALQAQQDRLARKEAWALRVRQENAELLGQQALLAHRATWGRSDHAGNLAPRAIRDLPVPRGQQGCNARPGSAPRKPW